MTNDEDINDGIKKIIEAAQLHQLDEKMPNVLLTVGMMAGYIMRLETELANERSKHDPTAPR